MDAQQTAHREVSSRHCLPVQHIPGRLSSCATPCPPADLWVCDLRHSGIQHPARQCRGATKGSSLCEVGQELIEQLDGCSSTVAGCCSRGAALQVPHYHRCPPEPPHLTSSLPYQCTAFIWRDSSFLDLMVAAGASAGVGQLAVNCVWGWAWACAAARGQAGRAGRLGWPKMLFLWPPWMLVLPGPSWHAASCTLLPSDSTGRC